MAAHSEPSSPSLPIPDFDHLPLGSVEHRVHALDAEQVQQLIDHEREHGNRLPVIVQLEGRLQQLARGAEPSRGTQGAIPESPPPAATGSKVSPSTSGPAMNPPSHGVPTNPAQPRPTNSGGPA